MWRLGESRRSPVLLARDIVRLWREPAMLDRVRVAGGDIRVITPEAQRDAWRPLRGGRGMAGAEDRFAFYGGGISFIGAPREQSPVQAVDRRCRSTNRSRPTSEFVTLHDWPGGPIRCSATGGMAVFGSLWSFRASP